jgi:hypothetical protein
MKEFIGKYLTYFFIVFFSINFIFYELNLWRDKILEARKPEKSLTTKLSDYAAHRQDYDIVFIGDSRTYCGIHVELLDPMLSTHSINLSRSANWFPTQLPMAHDLSPLVPRKTTVVWSIGHANFYRSVGITEVYPIGISLAANYVLWGAYEPGLANNIMFYNPILSFVGQSGFLNASIIQPFLAKNVFEHHNSLRRDNGHMEQLAEKLQREYSNNPQVERAKIFSEGGSPNSLVVNFKGGSFYRIEIDPSFFRRKQNKSKHNISDEDAARYVLPRPDPGLFRIFIEILDTFKKHNVRLVVNEIEEAPNHYDNLIIRSKWRDFMRAEIEPRVRRYGFSYIRADLDHLDDTDYFDYNHLNSKGAAKYLPMLAAQLKPQLNSSY